jgi:hypothetical protein
VKVTAPRLSGHPFTSNPYERIERAFVDYVVSMQGSLRSKIPDQIKVEGGFYVVGGSLTLDRYGRLYASGGLLVDFRKLHSARIFGAGVGVQAGWAMQTGLPAPDHLMNLNTGPSIGGGISTPIGGVGIDYSQGVGSVLNVGFGGQIDANFNGGGGAHVSQLPVEW